MIAEFMVAWHIMRLMTARPNINAIPAVVPATPSIVNYNGLPLRLRRGVVPVLNN
jgi:hypothetical protein